MAKTATKSAKKKPAGRPAAAKRSGGSKSGAGKGSAAGEGAGEALAKEQGRQYAAGGVKLPSPGPLSGRKSCEPAGGLTSLTSEPWGNETLRKDGAL